MTLRSPKQIKGRRHLCRLLESAVRKTEGQGAGKKQREMVFLPLLKTEPEPPPETKPGPKEPPKIWGGMERPQ